MSLRYYEITEGGSRILNPLNGQHLLFIGGLCDLKPGMRQLDLACGEGEMLCRYAQAYGTSGVGVDISTVFLGNARARADELGVADRVSFVQGDGATYAELIPDTPGAFDIVSCIGATWIGGGTVGTLDLMRPALKDSPEALLLVGEVFWKGEPDAEAAAAMGFSSPDDVQTARSLLDSFEQAGVELLEMVAATTEMWDRYAAPHWLRAHDWLRAHPDDLDAPGLRAWIANHKHEYLRYERRYLDWAVFVLKPFQ